MDRTSRLVLILDIDETLVYSSSSALDAPHDFEVGPFLVHKRPHLDAFLESVVQWFDVAIWTSASEDYAGAIVQRIAGVNFIPKFLWAADRCTRRFHAELREEYWIKDLKKLKRSGVSLERVLVIDDSPEKHERNYGNLIQIRPFTGDPNDNELQRLILYLATIRTCDNVRQIEKRNWRNDV